MSNTYFKLKKEVVTPGFSSYPEYTNEYELTLTAFVGNKENLQLTVQTHSSFPNQSGIAYITLSLEDVELLIKGLKEREEISATGYGQSKYSPAD